ncbi:unnamed protein product [Protopolystoma xenopodis]|uniref:Uncharacterized protein n=1 Tax=Protopolystoma xenopodis TaxID=117903 RepID=A0A3S5AGL8_9PLAT|nr:unnamed protein product [Protopolystoma xenopodis]
MRMRPYISAIQKLQTNSTSPTAHLASQLTPSRPAPWGSVLQDCCVRPLPHPSYLDADQLALVFPSSVKDIPLTKA